MGLEVGEVSVRLDGLLLRFMDQMENLQEKRIMLNSLIEAGWFSMSKARYAMGNKCVSSLQYGHEMAPLVRLHTRALEKGEVQFRTERMEPKPVENSKEEPKQVEEIGPKEEVGVRRRKTVNKKTDQEDPLEPKDVPDTKEKTEPDRMVKGQISSQDPLKWFGILVPQSLKQAQSSFKQVIELAAEIAALQTQIEATREEFRTQLKSKQQLLQGRES
ncbi:coiled-coil domain-containing protein 115 isoform X1 [Polyodon spathula]|uniref:coiled-coil domain-containing protein 115 isoform X1 n=1 Tax=Polyodon spathula TaxID=7913 RepID=UPI001B7EB3EF|nr:coiled-coil domain-containing protein 115 isoform X1 [Polyodon spathula]XP_041129724.1 coiled-coil domain-containing protein 115 isoform X1 [Polyodon spathula]XP_041129725.1 coiled-coil domain-containing protein 115 isoform X1 [Polyodon spathula]